MSSNPLGAPVNANSNDFLRSFDTLGNKIIQVEMGPRGDGSIALLDLHMKIYDDKVRFLIWSATTPGGEFLQALDKYFSAVEGAAARVLFKLNPAPQGGNNP